jgi:signal transduction histidine kinase
LADWHAAIDESDVELVASELVTNAVEHSSSSTIDLDIACSDNHVYVAVRDTANLHFPIFRRPANGTHAGRGLRIIASYAMWWGVTVRPDHKTVWAEFATPARG